MDGDRRECPIVPNNVIHLRYGETDDDVLHVSASHDVIQVFPDPTYNYLRYFDPPQGQMIAVFLGHEVLADLLDGGIPLCIRDSITEGELEVYEHHLGKLAIAASGVMNCIEVEEAVDQIEEQVREATAHLDDELRYYLGE